MEPVVVETSISAEVAPTPTPMPIPISGSHEDWLTQAGVNRTDWDHADFIFTHESGWCPTKWNGQYGKCPETPTATGPGSSAYGICQSLPGTKMAVMGSDWRTNPVTQIKWCNQYAKERYGGWSQAEAFWKANGWW